MGSDQIPDDDTGHAIKRWADEGSDLTRPMKIDFFIEVADESAGARFGADSALVEFNTSVERDEESGRCTCYCAKTMIPDYHAIVAVEMLLSSIARKYGATYAGFGSFGNA